MPRVSVAIGIYNCEETLAAAIESLINQTASDFEIIMCDDGSTDGTLLLARILATKDTRISVYCHQNNMGLNHALNTCLKKARGEFYARMDGDDVCSPDRLAKLVAYLENNPGISIVSSWMKTFDSNGEWGLVRTKPLPAKNDFLVGSPFCHAPCMMRTDVLRELGGYGVEPFVRRCEDLDLWFRMYAAGHKGANIQEPLYSMRDDRNARKRRTFLSRINEAKVRLRGYKMLKLSLLKQFYALRPIIVGLLPAVMYDFLHRWRLRK